MQPSPRPSRWASIHLPRGVPLDMVSLALASVLPSLGSSVAPVALPTLATSFQVSFGTVQWVVLAYLGALTLALFVVGGVSDRVGHGRFLRVGLVVQVVASGAGLLAPSLPVLLAARAGQGVGAAIIAVAAMGLLSELVPAARTGRAMGLMGSMSALGTALGPSLGGALVGVFGWRGLFVPSVVIGVAAHGLALRYLPRTRPVEPAPRGGRLGGILEPLFDAHLRVGLGTNVIVSAVLMSTLVVGPFHLAALGLDAAAIGGVMSIGPITAAIAGVPAGRLVDHLGPASAAVAGLSGLSFGTLLMTVLAPGALAYAGALVVVTAGYALFQAANNTVVLRGALPHERGARAAALNLSRNVGLMAGTSVLGAVFMAAGLPVAFAVSTGLVLVALAFTRAARPTTHHP